MIIIHCKFKVDQAIKTHARFDDNSHSTILTINDISMYKSKDEFSHKYGHVFHILMTHISATKDLKVYGDQAATVIVNEFEQLVHTENLFQPILFNSLTVKQQKHALTVITLIKKAMQKD